MKNMSKKTRKRILRTINANCHFSDGVWVPFESSKLSTIWKFIGITQKLRNTRYGPIYGVLFDDRLFKEPCIRPIEQNILSPNQLINPRCPIPISLQIVQRWKEQGYLYE